MKTSYYVRTDRARHPLRRSMRLALAVAACSAAGHASAESLMMEEVITTAVAGGEVSKMESSLSITTVNQERISNSVARSTTEILRSIPGIRSESSAGESNTNISIRGIPVASGGGKFLQLHEDGLPVLQFGDIIVGNADNYISYDWTTDRLEAVKGGSAATLASNSPAGIINFVSKTGAYAGGSVGITSGLDYDSQRVDFEYGEPLNDEWQYHVGGYYREGEGIRETGFDGNKGGQIKISVTRHFDMGHVRVYGKVLDDQTSTYLPMPVRASSDSVTGFDALTGSNIPRELLNARTGDGGTGIRNSSIGDGSKVESKVIGAEFEVEFDNGITLRDKIRLAKNSGKFFGSFTAAIGDATNAAGISGVLGTATDLAYVTGPNAGTPLTAGELAGLNGNGLIQNIRSFDNDIESLDNFSHDISLTKSFEMVDVTLGYYTASQDVDVNWYWQTYLADVSDDVRLLDAFAGATQLTEGGLVAFGAPDWGFCCYRDTALATDLDAVYLALNSQVNDMLSLTASVRYDDGEGVGHYAFGANNAVDFDADGTITNAEANAQTISQAAIANSQFQYDWDYVSWAIGANLLLTDQTAIFANISEGGRANADRLGDGGFLVNGTAVNGSVENTLNQYEAGIKHENDTFGVFATLFYVETDDVNSEGTNGATNTARVREYESTGLEIEAVANLGELSLFGGFTYTDAEIVGSNDPTLIGNTPRRQADFVYSGNAVYNVDAHRFGLGFVGTTDSYAQDANGYEMEGYTYFNAFAEVSLAEGLSATIAVNNLFDEFGMTEVEENAPVTINGVDYVRGRSITGRSTSISLKHVF